MLSATKDHSPTERTYEGNMKIYFVRGGTMLLKGATRNKTLSGTSVIAPDLYDEHELSPLVE